LVGRQRHGRRARAIDHAHAGRERHAACTRRDGVLGQGAELGGPIQTAKDQLPGLQVRGRDLLAVGAGGDDTAGEVDAGRGGAAGHEAAEDGDLGESVIDGVEGYGEDLHEGLVGCEGGRACRERGAAVELQVFLQGGGGADELPGFHGGGEFGGHLCLASLLGQ